MIARQRAITAALHPRHLPHAEVRLQDLLASITCCESATACSNRPTTDTVSRRTAWKCCKNTSSSTGLHSFPVPDGQFLVVAGRVLARALTKDIVGRIRSDRPVAWWRFACSVCYNLIFLRGGGCSGRKGRPCMAGISVCGMRDRALIPTGTLCHNGRPSFPFASSDFLYLTSDIANVNVNCH